MQTYPPGTRIGQYEIASLPMMGGMGVVYFALDHSNDGHPVAIKTFRPELLPDRAARDRFLREGTAWIELGRHPHIVRCYKVEYIDPTAFLVLELIAKEQNMPDASLRSWLIPGRPLPLEQALLFALQIAHGMQYATEKISGFVHRDLKPENILVGADRLPGTNVNRLRVTDFGLVKTIAGSHISSTATDEEELKPNQVQFTRGVGTPLYMAPEQWKGEPVGAFTDVYAFGCILYEMLSGQRAAEGKTVTELQASHCEGKLRVVLTNLSRNLTSLLTRCLALNPVYRYERWNEITDELERAYSEQCGHPIPQSPLSAMMSREEKMQAGWSYNAMALVYADIGKAEVAAEYLEKALSIALETGDRRAGGAALGNLGNAYLVLGDMRQAIAYYKQQLEIAQEVSDRREEGNALGNLGNASLDLGDVQQAINYFRHRLGIAHEIGDRRGEGNALGNLGNAYLVLGDVRQAITYYKQQLGIVREIGEQSGEGNALNNLGNAYLSLGDVRQAISYQEQALTIDRGIGNRRGEGSDLGGLGIAYLALGDVRQAIAYFKQQLEIIREIGDRRGKGIALSYLGSADLSLGNVRQAIGYYEESLAILREVGDRRWEGNAMDGFGRAYLLHGDTQRAIGYHEESLAILREVGDRRGEGIALCGLGDAYLVLANAQRAIGYYEESLTIMREIGDRAGESADLGNLGVAYAGHGESGKAIDYFEQAIAIRREVNDLKNVAGISLHMARLYTENGETARALPLAEEAANIMRQIGDPKARRAQALVTQLQGNTTLAPAQANPAQAAFEAFQGVSSPKGMQAIVGMYPFMKEDDFIRAVEQAIAQQVPPNEKPALAQRLVLLREIAKK